MTKWGATSDVIRNFEIKQNGVKTKITEIELRKL